MFLHIGGLIGVGFGPDETYMLAISHNGRGVFCTTTWERVARDYGDAYPENGYGIGIGPIDGLAIPVIEMYWESFSEQQIVSPSGRIRLRCASDGIAVLRWKADAELENPPEPA